MYHFIIKRIARKSFQLVNEHRYEELVQGMAPNIQHRFAGDHALGGARNDKAAVKKWLERLGCIMPNLNLTITNIIVHGWPNNTIAVVQWEASTVLKNGEPYQNRGVHIIRIKWSKAVSLDVHEDSQAVANALDKQFQAGIKEAKASQIIS
jgi:ketosteroid isomerase-like protein